MESEVPPMQNDFTTNLTNQTDFTLNLSDHYHNTLDIEGFSSMMKDPSYCYKFYWLEAIVKLIAEDVSEATFGDVIDEMIANAWYSVREFHIHLSGMQADGQVRDGLERAVLKLTEISNLAAHASKVEIKNAIKEHESELKTYKVQLTNMVPYRALAGFFRNATQARPWESAKRMTAYIEMINKDVVLLPYTLGESSNINKEIYFNESWRRMIQENTVAILGWIQYEKIKWLQNNNPEVPGLVYKLAPMDEKMRKLANVRNLWNEVLVLTEVRDVFTGKIVDPKKYEVDHFIPWSYVMNDELWNLMPMDSSLNSAKSNKLPIWDRFFGAFAENQYMMYEFIYENEKVHMQFEKCYKDNLHSIWAGQELYRRGNTKDEFVGILRKNMQPVYDSAKRQGYEVWRNI